MTPAIAPDREEEGKRIWARDRWREIRVCRSALTPAIAPDREEEGKRIWARDR